MNDRVKRYENYGISKDRYLELKYIARQYDAMRAYERRLRRGEVDRERTGNGVWHGAPDPTAAQALFVAQKSVAGRIRAIEQAAQAADRALAGSILRSVTRAETYEQINPACGRRQFFAARRRFFVELDARL